MAFGDRKDGKLLKNLDSMHFITPLIYPNRCDNEAYISERIDLTNINKYLEEKNLEESEYKYSLFQIIVAAILKTITLRPKMNRFIANRNFYQRNEISAAFVVKKIFSDDGGEALAFVRSDSEDTMDSIHQKIYKQVSAGRSDKADPSTESMNIFNKLPRFFSKFLVSVICKLDVHGKVPAPLIESDPYYSSVILTNLGSIKLHAGYHHLTNWGTTSIFLIVGEKKVRPFFNDKGEAVMKDSIDIGFTIDERLADGYYYSKTIALFKYLLENPWLLDQPLNTEVSDYEQSK